jgi:hypothetical protein
LFPYFILGLALLVGFMLLGKWFVGANPASVAKVLRWGLAIVAGLVLFFFFLRGNLGLLLAVLAGAVPMISAALLQWRRAKAGRGPSPGQQSALHTDFLDMTLDHDSGEMTGRVSRGAYAGARLEDLELGQLLALWGELRAQDAQSAAVLEAYLDRRHGEAWREAAEAGGARGSEGSGGASGAGSPGGGAMSEAEALEILGLEKNPTRAAVNEAHRRLMQKVHPDHGGSNYLASKINEAKDLLLRLCGE